jgi:hypothetical protein
MTYFPESEEKKLVRGDDRTFNLFVRLPATTPAEEASPTPVDLTGCRLTFTLKRLRADGKSVHADAVVLVKTNDDTAEIEVSDQEVAETRGRASIYLTREDTQFLAPGPYAYDVQLRTAANKNYTVLRGRVYLDGDVTAAEDGTVP